ncbi:MAG: tRNA (adenosine(37)-N6)-dimethylallyltransferase MiaA [Burkholderiaceae bacterium]|jgi:tRNA dimethylallyltransferase|nr:tRNA (adenosine(37)-N6)-dimethylallyltransferase MiaA [Burkholderiaceae bacterium]
MTFPAGIEALAIAGPTASGKSALALLLAERLPIEIISVDSALVYRGLDIGTAKPSLDERAHVPHHLIDIRDPRQPYSAAEFAHDARLLIPQIRARQRLPVLVGGTMLYFKALRDGLDPLPPADAAIRAQIDQQARARGWPALHAELARIDPATAARLPPGDSQRIQRALEVWQLTGRPLSDWFTARPAPASSSHHGHGGIAGHNAPRIALFALEPQDRAWLHQRIAARLDAMLAQGFLAEVRALRARGDLGADLPALRAVGYRQAWQALDSAGDASLTPAQLAALRDQATAATRQLAKRQLTWLRGMTDRTVLPICQDTQLTELADELARHLPSAGLNTR